MTNGIHTCQAARPCVCSLACWWQETMRLEKAMGYEGASPAAKKIWDDLMSAQIPAPSRALYLELWECVERWIELPWHDRAMLPCLLDLFYNAIVEEQLDVTQYGVLAAFRVKKRLRALRSVRAA
jgi:hypothetical protein